MEGAALAALEVMNSRLLKRWNPEKPELWDARRQLIANRNLLLSIPSLFLSFAVWMVWSVVVVNLPAAGFNYSTNQLFWLAALPGFSGATLRIFYAFLVPLFGGRRWTAMSTASLLLPAIGMGLAVSDPTTSYPAMLLLALLCGLGGGNFSSSMANISYFFPLSRQGFALGLNAGLGNLGVFAAQWLVPLAIGAAWFGDLGGVGQLVEWRGQTRMIWLQNAGYIWVLPILLSAFGAWFGMNDIEAISADLADQAVIFRQRNTWLLSLLYLGSFGSFIGYSAAMPMLVKSQFPDIDPTSFIYVGPLLGALARPVGGWISDWLGGARVTLGVFIGMLLMVAGLFLALPNAGGEGYFHLFIWLNLGLFALCGIGNASTFRMIVSVFDMRRQRQLDRHGVEDSDELLAASRTEAAAALGFAGAVGAYGGFFIPKSFGSSIALTGSINLALFCFGLFYLCCIAVTWWFYVHRQTP